MREFRLQMAIAGGREDAAVSCDTEFDVVARKVDRFLRLRERRVDAARRDNERSLIRREFGSLLNRMSAS